MNLTRVLITVALAGWLAACTGLVEREADKQALILGTWQAEFQGQHVTLHYDEDEITVREFGISFPYEWLDENHIRLYFVGQEVTSEVVFESPDRMIQTGSGGEQVLTRLP